MRAPLRAFFLAGALGAAVAAVREPAALAEPPPATEARDTAVAFDSAGQDAGAGNLVGIQPWLDVRDYASRERLAAKLRGYLAACRDRGWLGGKSIAIFPEYVGTWLVAEGETEGVYAARTTDDAMQALVLGRLGAFLWQLPGAPAGDRVRYALFALKAREMAASYDFIFSGLAREFGITVVAGSILLPGPRVEDGHLRAGSGPLYNASVVYGPAGTALGVPVRKVFLTGDERPFVGAGTVRDLPIFETPAGRLAVLVCADSWYPDSYRSLDRPDLVAVPSYAHTDGSWSRSWGGYDGPVPEDVDPADPGKLREHEAWLEYALPGRMKSSGARAGLNVFLRGRLWDLGADGQTLAVDGSGVHLGPLVDGPAVFNLWLRG